MGVFFIINGQEVLINNYNKIRTLWGWKVLKNKNFKPRQNFTGSLKKMCMTSLHCQSEISGFGKTDFYLKDHTFHITLYPKAYWKILVWSSCMTSFSIFFIKWLLVTYDFLRSQTPKCILCVVWLRMMLSIFWFHPDRTI